MNPQGFTDKDRKLMISIAKKLETVDARVDALENVKKVGPSISGSIEKQTIHQPSQGNTIELGFIGDEFGIDNSKRTILATSIYDALRSMCTEMGITTLKVTMKL